jgi:cytochrome P450
MTTAAVNLPPLAPTPHVRGLPLIGSLLDFRSERLELLLRVGREHRDVARMKMGFFPVLMVSSARGAHEVLVEKQEHFKKSAGLAIFARPVLGDGLLTSERDVHKRQRRMMAPVFAHKRIAAYGDVMVDKSEVAARSLDAHAATGDVVDLAEEMMRLTLDIVGKTLFDAEMAGHAAPIGEALTVAMRQMMRSLVRLVPLPPAVPTPGNLRMRRATRTLDDVVHGMIRERRASGHDPGDMLSMLLATRDAEDGSALSDEEVRDQAMTIMLAGHETTANALAWTFYLLARSPEVRARLERELDTVLGTRRATAADLKSLPYTLQVFKEAMRLYPPAYMIGRRARTEVTVGGATVKKGQIVLINVVGIHRRPEVFPNPDRFDPDRFAPELEKQLPTMGYMPFGGGPRVCIGNQFALMEGHLVLATLARRFRFDLAGPAARGAIEAEPLVTLRPKGGLPVRVQRRAPAAEAQPS